MKWLLKLFHQNTPKGTEERTLRVSILRQLNLREVLGFTLKIHTNFTFNPTTNPATPLPSLSLLAFGNRGNLSFSHPPTAKRKCQPPLPSLLILWARPPPPPWPWTPAPATSAPLQDHSRQRPRKRQSIPAPHPYLSVHLEQTLSRSCQYTHPILP